MSSTESSAAVLDELRSARTYDERLSALERLLKERELRALGNDSAVKAAVAGLGGDGAQATPEQRLLALVLLGKLGRLGKEIKKIAQAQVRPLLERAPASLNGVAPKDQVRLCGLIAAQRQDWIPDYLARSCMNADMGDKSRLAAGVGLFQKSSTWEDGFRRLNALGGEPRSVAVTAIVLVAARTSITKSTAQPGSGFLVALARFVSAVPGREAAALTDPQAGKLASELVLLLDVTTANHPALLGREETAELLKRAKSLAPAGKLSAAAATAWTSMVGRIADIVRILATGGVPAIEWFLILERLAGSRESALKHTKAYAAELESAGPAVLTLLQEGYVPEATGSSLREADDSLLGAALLRAAELLPLLEAGRQHTDHAKALAVEVQGLARRRGLSVAGAPAEIVEYSPIKHRIAADVTSPPRMVKIVVPGVVRNNGEIVIPAIVEASGERGVAHE